MCRWRQTVAVERRDAAIRETDDGLIPPASLATSRTPLPIARNCLAFSILAVGIGGRPNRIDKLRAAACPRKIRSRRLWRRCSAIIAAVEHRHPVRGQAKPGTIVINQNSRRAEAAGNPRVRRLSHRDTTWLAALMIGAAIVAPNCDRPVPLRWGRYPLITVPKTMIVVVLAAVGKPSGVSDARSLPEPSGRLWRGCARY